MWEIVMHRTDAASRRLPPPCNPAGRFFLGNVLEGTANWLKYLAECEGKDGKTVYDFVDSVLARCVDRVRGQSLKSRRATAMRPYAFLEAVQPRRAQHNRGLGVVDDGGDALQRARTDRRTRQHVVPRRFP